VAVKCNHSDLMVVYTSLLNVHPYKRYWEMETQECVGTARLCRGDLAADLPLCCVLLNTLAIPHKKCTWLTLSVQSSDCGPVLV